MKRQVQASKEDRPSAVFTRVVPSRLAQPLAQALAQTSVHAGHLVSLAGIVAVGGGLFWGPGEGVVSDALVASKPPVTAPVTSGQRKRVKGLEPSTFTLARPENRTGDALEAGLHYTNRRNCTTFI